MNFNINLTNFSKHIMEINNDSLIGMKRKYETEISKDNSSPVQYKNISINALNRFFSRRITEASQIQ
jgi:hypothetical protein